MRTATALFLVFLALTLSGCCRVAKVSDPILIEEPLLPVSGFRLPRRPYQPASLKFRIAVMNFVDQTKAAGDLVKTLPDVLTTALYKTDRFDLYDRGQLRDKTLNESESETRRLLNYRKVDALLQGAITQFRTGETAAEKRIVCDIRITDKESAVMFAKSANFRYTGKLDVNLNRDDMSSLAAEIAKRFPLIGEDKEFKVVSVSGREATLNIGADTGIMRGMIALFVAPGDLVRDTGTGEVLRSTKFIADAYVLSVEERMTRVRILKIWEEGQLDKQGRAVFQMRMPQVRVDDRVKFK
jgi:hypothetical protein